MSQEVIPPFTITSETLVNKKHANNDRLYGVYSDIQSALDSTRATRLKGRTVGVLNSQGVVEEFWFSRGIEDSDLVRKITPLNLKSTDGTLYLYEVGETTEITLGVTMFQEKFTISSSNMLTLGNIPITTHFKYTSFDYVFFDGVCLERDKLEIVDSNNLIVHQLPTIFTRRNNHVISVVGTKYIDELSHLLDEENGAETDNTERRNN